MTVLTICRVCGAEFEADRDRIVAGEWRTCRPCEAERGRPQHDVGGQCHTCGRHLRDPRRYLCLSCAGVSVS